MHPLTHPSPPLPQAVLKHSLGDSPFRLRVPEFSVRPGELVAVVGRVGAGKSSLLQAILGNMDLVGWGGRVVGCSAGRAQLVIALHKAAAACLSGAETAHQLFWSLHSSHIARPIPPRRSLATPTPMASSRTCPRTPGART